VTPRVRVSLGNERSDRPQGWAVAAAAVGGLVGGLLLVLALGRSLAPQGAATSTPGEPIAPSLEPASEPVSPTSASGTAVPSDPIAAQDAPAAAEPAPPVETAQLAAVEGGAASPAAATTSALSSAETAIDPSAAGPAPAPGDAVPATAVPPASAGRELVRGHIAYLRCEGVPLQEGPFPCPRDRRFEKQVWSALERLQQCAVPASHGDVELRIEFRTRGRHSFEVKPADGSEALAKAAHACMAADLELVRTSLRPLLMTVAFRFELR
jgi:hypothetical protein